MSPGVWHEATGGKGRWGTPSTGRQLGKIKQAIARATGSTEHGEETCRSGQKPGHKSCEARIGTQQEEHKRGARRTWVGRSLGTRCARPEKEKHSMGSMCRRREAPSGSREQPGKIRQAMGRT